MLNIEPSNLVFCKLITLNLMIYQNGRLLDIKDKVDVTLLINK